MNHKIKGFTRTLAVIAGATLLIAACGGGSSSSGRQRNAALDCYADQAAMDDAVAAAKSAFDASFGGDPPPSDDSGSKSSVPDSSVPDSSVPDSSVPDSSVPDLSVPEVTPDSGADGGGYRRPAFRHFASVPPTEPSSSVSMTEEQQGFMDALNAAESREVCADSSEDASADPAEVTCTATVTVDGVTDDCTEGDVILPEDTDGRWALLPLDEQLISDEIVLARGTYDVSALGDGAPITISISYTPEVSSDPTSSSETETTNCTGTFSGTLANYSSSTDCPEGVLQIRSGNGDGLGTWGLAEGGIDLDSGDIDMSTLSADNPIVVEISYEIASVNEVEESSSADCLFNLSEEGFSFECNAEITVWGELTSSNDSVSKNWRCLDEGEDFAATWSYETWDSFTLVVFINEEEIATLTYDGEDADYEVNLPDDVVNESCGTQTEDGDWDSLPFSGETVDGVESYSFTVPQDFDGPVLVKSESTEDFDFDFYDDDLDDEVDDFEGFECVDNGASCSETGYSIWNLDAGKYFFYIYDNEEVVTWTSNIEIRAVDYSDLEFSRRFTGYSRMYDFSLEQTTNVVITANSFQEDCDDPDNEPEIQIFSGSAPYSYKDYNNYFDFAYGNMDSAENCDASVLDIELDAGNYFIWVSNDEFNGDDEGTAVVTVESSVELVPYVWPQTPLPATKYSTSFDTEERSYSFTLSEETDVTFTASTNQSCTPDDFWAENDGFVTPGSYLFTQDAWDDGDWDEITGSLVVYGSPTNCAVNIIQQTLEAGNYVFVANNDYEDKGTITIGSSVEIGMSTDFSFDLITEQVNAIENFEFEVPVGGLWFRAEGNTWSTEWYGDDFVDPVLILVDENNETVQWSNNERESDDNIGASLIELFLPEGKYRIIATMWDVDTWDVYLGGCDDCPNEYELRYGFASETSSSTPEVALEPTTNNEMPTDLPAPEPAPVSLPVSGLTIDGTSNSSAAIAQGVSTMVCDATCIDTLFTNAGITDGTIEITVGGETVTVEKGQKRAIIPVGDNAKRISVVVKSADGTQKVELTDGLKVISSEMQQALDSKTTSGASNSSSGSASKLPYALALLVVLLGAAAVVNVRRKKTVAQS